MGLWKPTQVWATLVFLILLGFKSLQVSARWKVIFLKSKLRYTDRWPIFFFFSRHRPKSFFSFLLSPPFKTPTENIQRASALADALPHLPCPLDLDSFYFKKICKNVSKYLSYTFNSYTNKEQHDFDVNVFIFSREKYGV